MKKIALITLASLVTFFINTTLPLQTIENKINNKRNGFITLMKFAEAKRPSNLPTGWYDLKAENYYRVSDGQNYYGALLVHNKEGRRAWYLVSETGRTVKDEGEYEDLAMAATAAYFSRDTKKARGVFDDLIKKIEKIYFKIEKYDKIEKYLIGPLAFVFGFLPALIEGTSKDIVNFPSNLVEGLREEFGQSFGSAVDYSLEKGCGKGVESEIIKVIIKCGEEGNKELANICIQNTLNQSGLKRKRELHHSCLEKLINSDISLLFENAYKDNLQQGIDSLKEARTILLNAGVGWDTSKSEEFFQKFIIGYFNSQFSILFWQHLQPKTAWETIRRNCTPQFIRNILFGSSSSLGKELMNLSPIVNKAMDSALTDMAPTLSFLYNTFITYFETGNKKSSASIFLLDLRNKPEPLY